MAVCGVASTLYYDTPGAPMLGTVDSNTGVVTNVFTPTSAKSLNGRGVAVVGNTVYYTVADNHNVYAANLITHADLGVQFTVTQAPQGLANIVYDGTNFWISDYTSGSNKVFEYTTTGTFIKTITLSNCTGTCDGLAFFIDPGTHTGRLISNEDDNGGLTGHAVYDVYDTNGNLVTANFISTFAAAHQGTTGIAWDGSDFFVAEGGADIPGHFYEYDSNGAFIKTIALSSADPLQGNSPFEGISAAFISTGPGPGPGTGVPEPSAILLCGAGFLALIVTRARLKSAG